LTAGFFHQSASDTAIFQVRKDISNARLTICVTCTAEKFTVGVFNILVVNLEKRFRQLEKNRNGAKWDKQVPGGTKSMTES
jgi:hypothetical protein